MDQGPEQGVDCPLVSVVTPSYNSMPYIKKTIESIRLQGYPHIQHIIVDGNSNDGTQELLQHYPELLWLSEPDSGQSSALNKGFRLAKGEIIGWLNADDTYSPGAVCFAVEYLTVHPEVDLIYSDVQIIDENDQPIRLTKGEPFSIDRLLLYNMVKQPSVFFRRRILETLKGVNNDLHYTMDRELWLRAGMSYTLRYVPEVVLANFRFCKGTKSYEALPEFHQEWMKYLIIFQKGQTSDTRLLKKVNHAIGITMSSYHVSLMLKAVNERKRPDAITNCVKAVRYNRKCLFQRGLWKLLYLTYFGGPGRRESR